MSALFDGVVGKVAARVMAVQNREAEIEAVELLAATSNARILVIGFGPGIGIEHLVSTHHGVTVVGVDPSAVMVQAASRRNRSAIERGRVELLKTTVERMDSPVATFDGAIAVNSLQLCDPPEPTARALAHLMRPAARLVSLTHDWATAKHAGMVERWLDRYQHAFRQAGFDTSHARARAEGGRAVVFTATRVNP
jgi:SAM-dependent methyltransferase